MSAPLLAGKIIFLTGGAGGIGRACLQAYRREGACVALADLGDKLTQQLAAELDSGVLAVECDVSDGDSVRQAIRKTVERFGRLDAVHNNAGLADPSKTLHETSEEEWDRVHTVNLKSVYWTTRFAFEHLRVQQGSILNTASLSGEIGQALHAAYVSTKGAMIALTKAMALDYAPHRIRVNALCPAGVWTPMLRDWARDQPNSAEMESYLNDIHVLGYCPEPDVVADCAVFLLSERARFLTGCILPVSGGAELGYRRLIKT